MSRFRTITAATLGGFALLLGGLVAIPTQGNAGVAATLTPFARVDTAFATLAKLDPAMLGISAGNTASRTVMLGYQTDMTGALLLRKPGA